MWLYQQKAYLQKIDPDKAITELEHLVSQLRDNIIKTPNSKDLWDEAATLMKGIFKLTENKLIAKGCDVKNHKDSDPWPNADAGDWWVIYYTSGKLSKMKISLYYDRASDEIRQKPVIDWENIKQDTNAATASQADTVIAESDAPAPIEVDVIAPVLTRAPAPAAEDAANDNIMDPLAFMHRNGYVEYDVRVIEENSQDILEVRVTNENKIFLQDVMDVAKDFTEGSLVSKLRKDLGKSEGARFTNFEGYITDKNTQLTRYQEAIFDNFRTFGIAACNRYIKLWTLRSLVKEKMHKEKADNLIVIFNDRNVTLKDCINETVNVHNSLKDLKSVALYDFLNKELLTLLDRMCPKLSADFPEGILHGDICIKESDKGPVLRIAVPKTHKNDMNCFCKIVRGMLTDPIGARQTMDESSSMLPKVENLETLIKRYDLSLDQTAVVSTYKVIAKNVNSDYIGKNAHWLRALWRNEHAPRAMEVNLDLEAVDKTAEQQDRKPDPKEYVRIMFDFLREMYEKSSTTLYDDILGSFKLLFEKLYPSNLVFAAQSELAVPAAAHAETKANDTLPILKKAM